MKRCFTRLLSSIDLNSTVRRSTKTSSACGCSSLFRTTFTKTKSANIKMNTQAPPRLLIHLDINKTIIISDSASGKSTETVTNEIIAACVWGRVNHDELNKKGVTDEYKIKHGWTCLSSEPTVDVPLSLDQGTEILSFYSFIEEFIYPYVKVESNRNDNDGTSLLAQQLKHNAAVKSKRRALLDHFTAKGNIGEQFSKHQEALLERLLVKTHSPLSSAFSVDQTVNLIPSLFNLVKWLERRRLSGEIEYAIIFRTFGDEHDVHNVCSEFNDFCQGKHAYFALDDDLKESLKNKILDLTEKPDNYAIGYLYVNGNEGHNSYLVTGSLKRPVEMNQAVDPSIPIEQLIQHQKPSPDRVHLIKGVKDIYSTLLRATQDGTSAFYRDYWYWWNANREEAESGKRFVIDPEDQGILQIFFDDNAVMPGWPTRGIISLIDANTGHALDQNQHAGLNIWKSEPYLAIMDDHYFEKCVQESEKKWFNK